MFMRPDGSGEEIGVLEIAAPGIYHKDRQAACQFPISCNARWASLDFARSLDTGPRDWHRRPEAAGLSLMKDEVRVTGLDPARDRAQPIFAVDRAQRYGQQAGRGSPQDHPRVVATRDTICVPMPPRPAPISMVRPMRRSTLGTNNCRLLVARATHDGFRVIDAFSRIIRLGEGITVVRTARRARHRARDRGAAHLPRQDAQSRRHPRASDRNRSLPARGQTAMTFSIRCGATSASRSKSSTARPRPCWPRPAAPR